MKKLLLSIVALAATLTSMAQVSFYVNPPSTNSGNYSVDFADNAGGDWAMPDLTDPINAVEDTLVIVQGIDSLGCDPLTNGVDVNGKIALIWRGACQFGTKALNAQNAGAVAAVIVNNAGEPVGMAGGTDGINVTIPVVMISTNTGQLLYDEIMAGNDVSVFIGNKFGYFENDLAIGQDDVLRARQFATPIGLAANDTEFSVPAGAWVYNTGSNDQTNITLNTTVAIGATMLYNETSTAVPALASGDSVWISQPTFSETTYSMDYYTMVYTVASDSADEFGDDNSLNTDFLFTENEYSYSTVDQATALPTPAQYFRPGTFGTTFGNCIHFADANASRKAVLGLTFAATSDAGTSLESEIISLEAYEWADPVTDFNDPAFDINALNLLASGEFTFATDSQERQIYWPFDEPLALEDSKDYIFCAVSGSPTIFLGYDNAMDYDENIRGADAAGNIHGDGHTTTMVNNDNAYTALGFGTDVSSSVMINMVDVEELGVEEQEVNLDAAYPNPAVNMLTVPLNGLAGTGILNILDLSGKVLSSNNVNLSDSKLVVDVSEFAAGMYVFNLNLENGKTSTFNVVVSK